MLTKSEAYLISKVGDQSYAIPLCHVKEILPMMALSSPPGTARNLLGFMTVDQQRVPVVSMEEILHLSRHQENPDWRVIFLKNMKTPMGVAVQHVFDICDVQKENIRLGGERYSQNKTIVGEFNWDQKITYILNMNQFLLS